ncbi:hypothetical protein ABL78_4685 [Leptomonas seymouri]|uniref:Uncharacterized protein n=1 Tax=Leptomonas seymouri TaxID=5684 RepID=A0A0N0P5B4_LEPSE|nr:hypothetical protein ABL78_4685 [Leptomonas seymouri]|eukprot:KPI86259.1 hypothetical protein ABL78_4685 [Leptomonas seymouri]
MPQLQQLAARRAAAPHKASEEKPQQPRFALPTDALPLRPPVPTSVLFNVADGYAYQIMISRFDGATQLDVCVFTVRRVLLADTRALSLHIGAATNCGLPFCVVEGGVTWQDALITLALVEPLLRASPYGWDVQVLGMDTQSGGWMPITPALSSPLEAHYFLQTNVEVLFEYYGADSLHMQARPLMPNQAAADWRTPSERSTTPGPAPPPAPVKDHHNAPPRMCCSGAHQHPFMQQGRVPTATPPRSLAHDFDAVRTPPSQDQEEGYAVPPTATWSLGAFLQQQERWGQRCRELRERTANMSVDEVLQLVRSELQRHRPLPCAALEVKGTATWTLSLLEYECQLLSEKTYELCSGAEEAETRPAAEVLQTCREYLRHIEKRAVKVCQVVDAVWEAELRAEEGGAVPDDFPTEWLCLLLASLRLRCLRHTAFVHACTGFMGISEKMENKEAATVVAKDGLPPTETLGSNETLLCESVQTTERLLEALVSIGESPQDARLSPAALSEPLLAMALSLAELATYLPLNTSNRCVLMRAVVQVCRARLQCIAPRGDTHWLPICITDIAVRMQGRLNGIPLTSAAFAAYAELTDLLRGAADDAMELNAAAESVLSSAVPHESSAGALGYIIWPIPTTAAVDAAFVRGNTAIREFHNCAGSPKSQDPPSVEVTHEDAQVAHA